MDRHKLSFTNAEVCHTIGALKMCIKRYEEAAEESRQKNGCNDSFDPGKIYEDANEELKSTMAKFEKSLVLISLPPYMQRIVQCYIEGEFSKEEPNGFWSCFFNDDSIDQEIRETLRGPIKITGHLLIQFEGETYCAWTCKEFPNSISWIKVGQGEGVEFSINLNNYEVSPRD